LLSSASSYVGVEEIIDAVEVNVSCWFNKY